MMLRRLTLLALRLAPLLVAAHPEGRRAAQSLSSEIIDVLEGLPQTDSAVSQFLSSVRSNASEIDSSVAARRRSASSQASLACNALKVLFPESYVDASNQTAYSAEQTVNWATNCELPAACFVLPDQPFKVAVALKVVTFTGSKFAVRAGGHNPNAGFASVDGSGVLIDLVNLDALELSADQSSVRVGPGNRWGGVQNYLSANKLSAVGGRNKAVGVAGLLLGGGYPNIVSLYGLACDSVKNFEIVLGNSTIINANAQENADLFKALKGGGNNFGIVTNFDLYTVPLSDVWYKYIVYNTSDYKGILEALVEVQKGMESDENAGISVTAATTGFAVIFIYAGWSSGPAIFAPFDKFTPIETLVPPTNGTVASLAQSAVSPPDTHLNRESVGVSTLVDSQLYIDIYEEYTRHTNYTSNQGAALALAMNTFGSLAAKAGLARGGNVLGATQDAQLWWNPLAQWTDPSDAAKAHQTVTDLNAYIATTAKARGLYLPFIFANIASGAQDVMASYGSANQALLKSVSTKYDRAGVFQKLQNAGWFISKA